MEFPSWSRYSSAGLDEMGITDADKDNINLEPSFGIGTSGGAVALVDSVPASSATIVEKVSFRRR